jgi:uncharacterized membrane protein YfcA
VSIEGQIAVDRLIETTRAARAATKRSRARTALAVSLGVVLAWLLYVTTTDQWGRVADQWASSLTMVFGSFVAGSTPQGGGAVAFPVFTKALEFEPEVARTFALSIQSVGMGTAALAIVVTRRRVEWAVVRLMTPFAVAGVLVGLFALSRPGDDFWPSTLPPSYLKVVFTLLVAAMAFVVFLSYRTKLLLRPQQLPIWNRRVVTLLVVAGLIGGILSAQVGSGADLLLFIVVAVVLGVSPRVAVPTSVVVMAIVSIVGSAVLVLDGELARGPVSEPPLPDMFGLWLAAVPVVALGAPMGSWAASKLPERRLVVFVIALATVEVATTIAFLGDLYSELPLFLFAAGLSAVTISGLWLITSWQRTLFSLPALDLRMPILRGQLDVGPGYRDELVEEAR